MNENRQMYTDLENRLTKKYYREIVEKALAQAKEEYEQFPNDRMNISFYHQLLDIKKRSLMIMKYIRKMKSIKNIQWR